MDPDRGELLKILSDHCGLVGDARIYPSQTGKFNRTFFVEGKGLDRPLVFRIAPPDNRESMLFYEHRMMRQEPTLHRILRRNTSVPVPEIVYHERQNAAIGRDLVVMERMPGNPMSHGSERLMHELGEKLREVHESVTADSGRYGYLGEHRPMESQSTWKDAFAVMWNALLDDVERCQGAPGDEIAAWRKLQRDYHGVFEHFTGDAPLLHMDVWAENILTDDSGQLTGLIDWDRALWGDPEIEYAVLEYCGIDKSAFWKGYGRERPRDRDARIRRIFYLAYEILKYIVIRIARQNDTVGAQRFLGMGRELLGQLPA